MTFIRPSTNTSIVTPYAYGSLIESPWFDYVDYAIPNCLDKTNGDTITGHLLIASGGKIEFQAGSILQVDSGATASIIGSLTLGTIFGGGTFSALSGSTLSIAGTTTFTGTMSSNTNVTFTGNTVLGSSGTTLISNPLNASNTVTIGGTFTVNSVTTNFNGLGVNFGATAVNLNSGGSLNLNSGAGVFFFSGSSLSIAGTTSVSNNFSITGGATVIDGASLAVQCASTFSSNVTVTGAPLGLASCHLSLDSASQFTSLYTGTNTFAGNLTCNNLTAANNVNVGSGADLTLDSPASVVFNVSQAKTIALPFNIVYPFDTTVWSGIFGTELQTNAGSSNGSPLNASLPTDYSGATLNTISLVYQLPFPSSRTPAANITFTLGSNNLVTGAQTTIATGSVTNYNVAGVQTLTLTPNITLDTANNNYYVILTDEHGSGAVGGNLYFGMRLRYTNINNLLTYL